MKLSKLSDLIPSADLLEKIEGVEEGLLKRRRLGRLGKLGAVFAGATWLSQILNLLPKQLSGWPLAIIIGVLVLGLLVVFYSYWLKQSRHPIRYTCSLGHFSAVKSEESNPATPIEEKMAWLPHDLARRLNQRVGRLMFTREDEKPAKSGEELATGDRNTDQHIHIDGDYYIRGMLSTSRQTDSKQPETKKSEAKHVDSKLRDDTQSDGKQSDNKQPDREGGQRKFSDREIVVMPRVRIGTMGNPEKLALPIDYPLKHEKLSDDDDYRDLVEQVYFSVVTEIYRQIREDVKRKIELLPTRHHKAVAYYQEAEDYARSNTLRAYQEASELYRLAARNFEPFDLLLGPVRRQVSFRDPNTLYHLGVRKPIHLGVKKLIRWLTRFRPALIRSELLSMRSRLGYANMLVFRRMLSWLLGQRLVAVFEARPFAERTLASLAALKVSEDMPTYKEYKECLFDAYVTNALVWSALGDPDQSLENLNIAERHDPLRATTSAVYLLAKSECFGTHSIRYEALLRAVEQDPRLEVAQFSAAFEREMMWRAGPTPTRRLPDARMVVHGYRHVLRLNPGDIGAAANAAFVLWTLGREQDLEEARHLFLRALHYKELAPETLLSEHHYGLARIYAEMGDFDGAYDHLTRARDGLRAHRDTHMVDSDRYFFCLMGTDLRRRFNRYRKKVLKQAQEAQKSTQVNRHIIDSVCAFALGEYGEACRAYVWRIPGKRGPDLRIRNQAKKALEWSIAFDSTATESLWHLAELFTDRECRETERRERISCLEKMRSLDPSSREAQFALAWQTIQKHRQLTEQAEMLDDYADTVETIRELRKELDELEAKQRQLPGKDADRGVQKAALPFNLGGPDFQTDIHAAKTRLKEKQDRLKTLEAKLDPPPVSDDPKMNKKAADQRRVEAKESRLEAQQPALKVLPHNWLWRTPGSFDDTILSNPHYEAEGKWEREFNDFQAEALYQWALPLLTTNTQPGKALIDRIRKKFFPCHWQLLNDLMTSETEQTSRRPIAKKLARILKDNLEMDPVNLSLLRHFDNKEIARELEHKGEFLKTQLRHGIVPDQQLGLLMELLVQEGDEHFGKSEWPGAKAKYREALGVQADVAETRQAAGKLAMLLAREAPLEELESLIKQSLPETYAFLPSANKEPPGIVEKFLKENEPARIRLKLCYERRLRQAADKDRTTVDAVMGLLNVAGEGCGVRPASDGGSPPYTNVRVPLAVEWDARLLPEDPDDFLLKEAAPRLRQQLEDQYGVLVPGIRFRAIEESSRPGLYRILDHDVVVEEGTVPASAADWQAPLRFTMEQLYAYLERHLSQWIRVQEVQNLLERHWLYHSSFPGSVSEFETHKHIGPLTIVIRSLVAERVPIHEFATIYDTYRALWAAGEPVQVITRQIRILPGIQPKLWGNDTQYQRFILSEEAEAELSEACEIIDGFMVLALQPERRDEWITTLAAAIQPGTLASITVRQPRLRPLVRRLVEQGLPDVPVLAKNELLTEVRAKETVAIQICPVKDRRKEAA